MRKQSLRKVIGHASDEEKMALTSHDTLASEPVPLIAVLYSISLLSVLKKKGREMVSSMS